MRTARQRGPRPPVYKGKIGRLPFAIREELNRRLHDGHPGIALLAWLNGLPAVKERLALYCAGSPVKEQNLSKWRTSGYQDWLEARRLGRASRFMLN